MPDHTVSGDVDSMLRSADDAAIRSAIGVGTTDAPTFLSVTAAGSATSSYTLGATGGGRSAALSLNNGASIGGLGIASNYVVAWSSANSSAALGNDAGNFGLLDLFLTRDAPGILAQRNVAVAQALRVYNSTDATPATNYDRGVFDFKTTTNTLRIGTENGGTYTTARPIDFVTGGVVRMSIAAAGAVVFQGTVTASGLTVGQDGYYFHANRSAIGAPGVGIHTLLNNGGTDYNRLQLGGTTSAFPAIKRNGTGIHIVLADDSAFAPITCGSLVANSHLRTTDTAQIGWLNTRSSMISPSDGVIRLTNNAGTSYTRLELGEADMGIMRGAGTPEGAVTAKVGSIFLRTDGTSGSSFYVKESGSGPNGWVGK